MHDITAAYQAIVTAHQGNGGDEQDTIRNAISVLTRHLDAHDEGTPSAPTPAATIDKEAMLEHLDGWYRGQVDEGQFTAFMEALGGIPSTEVNLELEHQMGDMFWRELHYILEGAAKELAERHDIAWIG